MVLLGFEIKYVLKDHFEKLVSGEGLKCNILVSCELCVIMRAWHLIYARYELLTHGKCMRRACHVPSKPIPLGFGC